MLPNQSLQVFNELTEGNKVLILRLEGLGSPGGCEFLLSFTRSKETKTERQMSDQLGMSDYFFHFMPCISS